MSGFAASVKSQRNGLQETLIYCEKCDFLESEQDEIVFNCNCKGVRYGNMDQAFKEAIRQVELLHEGNVD